MYESIFLMEGSVGQDFDFAPNARMIIMIQVKVVSGRKVPQLNMGSKQ
jgi:hypothetical protein